jgi:hypothetical protein
MRALRHRLVLAFGAAPAVAFVLASACSVGDLDLSAKQCPCLANYVCDVPSNRCLLEAPLDGAVIDDVMVPDAFDALAPAPLVLVSKLAAAWSTPNSIRWEWKLDGTAADFRAYEIVTGSSADAIAKRVGVEVLTSHERPELGAFDARGGKTSGPIDMWTLTDVRAAGQKQFVQVTVTDVNGQASRSAVMSFTSAVGAPGKAIIFDGTAQKTADPVAEFVFRSPAGGEPHYQLVTDCGAAKTCAKHGDLVSLALDVSPPGMPFSSTDFATAFLELQVDGNVAATSFDTTVGIELGANCPQGPGICRYRFPGWTQNATARTKLQVPLRELVNDVGKLTYGILMGKNFIVDALGMSGTWKDGSIINLYDARIRW